MAADSEPEGAAATDSSAARGQKDHELELTGRLGLGFAATEPEPQRLCSVVTANHGRGPVWPGNRREPGCSGGFRVRVMFKFCGHCPPASPTL
jgi:hypothetical protein